MLLQNVSNRILKLHQAARHAATDAPTTSSSLPRWSRPIPRSFSLLLSPWALCPAISPSFRLRVFQPVPQPRSVLKQTPIRTHAPGSLLPQQWRRCRPSISTHNSAGQWKVAGQLAVSCRRAIPTSPGGKLRAFLLDAVVAPLSYLQLLILLLRPRFRRISRLKTGEGAEYRCAADTGWVWRSIVAGSYSTRSRNNIHGCLLDKSCHW